MSKPKQPEPIRDFAAKTRVDVATWSAVQTDVSLMIAGIPTRDHAERLHEFLTGRGMLAALAMGGKRGETWAIVAREPMTGLPEDE